MDFVVLVVAAAVSTVGALFAFLAFLRSGRTSNASNDIKRYEDSLRNESDRIRQNADENSRSTRTELSDTLQRSQDATLLAFKTLGDDLRNQIKEFGEILKTGIESIENRVVEIGRKQDEDMRRMGEEANQNRESLRNIIETRLTDASDRQTTVAKETRQELSSSFLTFSEAVDSAMKQHGEYQKERLDNVAEALKKLTDNLNHAQETLRQSVENKLDTLRTENATKLEEMRLTVDEKLQTTLETRLGESFNRVVEQLQRVHEGIGQMQVLAADVGDLSRVLTNVRVRGTLGEVQLGNLLEQFLGPEQYSQNVQIKQHSQERVEFAIKLPGRDDVGEVLLPIDAKFPREDFERLLTAVEANNPDEVANAGKALEVRIRASAKSIRDKYIEPPKTTEFGILFLPVESLYAEVLRRPGLFEALHREFRVTLAGPTTLCAILNALQMGFKSLALEKRSSEVWQVLNAVQSEFKKYNTVVEKIGKQLTTAANTAGELGKRARIMNQTLRAVEKLPENAQISSATFALNFVDDADSDIDLGKGSALS